MLCTYESGDHVFVFALVTMPRVHQTYMMFWLLEYRATCYAVVHSRAFPVAAAKLWNSLLDSVTSADSLTTFRHDLKHLFQSHRSPIPMLFCDCIYCDTLSGSSSGQPLQKAFDWLIARWSSDFDSWSLVRLPVMIIPGYYPQVHGSGHSLVHCVCWTYRDTMYLFHYVPMRGQLDDFVCSLITCQFYLYLQFNWQTKDDDDFWALSSPLTSQIVGDISSYIPDHKS